MLLLLLPGWPEREIRWATAIEEEKRWCIG